MSNTRTRAARSRSRWSRSSESLRWLGLDWDGDVTFQLDSMPRHAEDARRLLAEKHAYEDDGAIRFRMPDGDDRVEDAIKGRSSSEREARGSSSCARTAGPRTASRQRSTTPTPRSRT